MLATRLVAFAYGVALAAALAGVLATLALPASIAPKTSTAHYGRPIWFAESDLSVWRDLSLREKQIPVPLDPLENPTSVSPARFLVSYAAFAAPLAAVVWLVGRARRRRAPP
jgi:hypothetical protein